MSKIFKEAGTKQKKLKYECLKKCMKNMQNLAEHCNLDAVYPFSNLY
jgi:hypothetical protein